MSILVIDDDDDVRETVVEALSDEGYLATGAASGAAALEALASGSRPAVIFLDLMMPGMSGTEFREEQLKDPELADIPVVVLTADANASVKAAQLHAAACLQKPVRLDELIAAAARFTARAS